jgi:hypothetical protein
MQSPSCESCSVTHSETLADRILRTLRATSHALDEDELARRLGVIRQQINQVCNRLANQGILRRHIGPQNKLVNEIIEAQEPPVPVDRQSKALSGRTLLGEDAVKAAVLAYLQQRGLQVEVKWGKERGIDIIAYGHGERWLIEAKGEVDSPQQQGSYFLQALGELVQRMDEPTAQYGLALPDNSRYRGLVDRLPALARLRLNWVVLFVRPDGSVREA